MYRLTIQDARGEPLPHVDIEVVPFIIGREPDADLVLTEETVSGRHAQLEVHAEGRVVLRDLGSTNGTWVAGRRIEGGIWLDLPGTFRIGSATFTLDALPAAASAIVAGDETIVAGQVPAFEPPRRDDAVPAAAALTGWGASAGTSSAVVERAPANPMPPQLARGLTMLLIVSILQILGGVFAFALANSGEVDEDLAAALVDSGIISIIAGGVELVLALFARRGNGIAAALLVAVAIGLALLGIADTIALAEAEAGLYLAVLRASLNGVGAVMVVMHRGWYGRWGARPA